MAFGCTALAVGDATPLGRRQPLSPTVCVGVCVCVRGWEAGIMSVLAGELAGVPRGGRGVVVSYRNNAKHKNSVSLERRRVNLLTTTG